jgi:Na+-driven multidrug efflux pump
MDVAGAALATVIAQTVSVILSIIIIWMPPFYNVVKTSLNWQSPCTPGY